MQQFLYWTTGSQFVAFIPLTKELNLSVDYNELSQTIMASNRSSAFFSEPAHFAQYVLVLLGIELFKKENRRRLLTRTSVFVIVSLLLLRSGNGFIGLLLLMSVKLLDYFQTSGIKTVLLLIAIIPLAWYGISQYAKTEVGEATLSRTEELTTTDSSGHSFYRLFRGYIIYSNMPLINQALGAFPDYLYTMNIPFLHETGEEDSDMYFNGFQSVLIFNGIIGLILLSFFYIKEARKSEILGKAQSLLLLTLSLIGQIFLSPIMLVCTGIISSKENDE